MLFLVKEVIRSALNTVYFVYMSMQLLSCCLLPRKFFKSKICPGNHKRRLSILNLILMVYDYEDMPFYWWQWDGKIHNRNCDMEIASWVMAFKSLRGGSSISVSSLFAWPLPKGGPQSSLSPPCWQQTCRELYFIHHVTR